MESIKKIKHSVQQGTVDKDKSDGRIEIPDISSLDGALSNMDLGDRQVQVDIPDLAVRMMELLIVNNKEGDTSNLDLDTFEELLSQSRPEHLKELLGYVTNVKQFFLKIVIENWNGTHPLFHKIVALYKQYPDVLKEVLSIETHSVNYCLDLAIWIGDKETIETITQLYIGNLECLGNALRLDPNKEYDFSKALLTSKYTYLPLIFSLYAKVDSSIFENAINCLKHQQLQELVERILQVTDGEFSEEHLNIVLQKYSKNPGNNREFLAQLEELVTIISMRQRMRKTL